MRSSYQGVAAGGSDLGPVTIDSNGQAANLLLTTLVRLSDATLSPSFTVFFNRVDSDDPTILTTPASPAVGTIYFVGAAVGTIELQVKAAGSQVIQLGAAATSAGGTLTTSTKGSLLLMVYVANNLWLTLSSGTWVAA